MKAFNPLPETTTITETENLPQTGAEDTPSWETLLRGIPDFQVRPVQQLMMNHVAEAIDKKRHLLIEAGTGAGKSFGYLVPLLLKAQRPIVISTGTIALQEQLLNKDIPLLAKALYGREDALTAKLVKGRSNYLCINKLEEVEQGLGTVKHNEPTEAKAEHHLRASLAPVLRRVHRSVEGRVQPRDSSLIAKLPILVWDLCVDRLRCQGIEECPNNTVCYDNEVVGWRLPVLA